MVNIVNFSCKDISIGRLAVIIIKYINKYNDNYPLIIIKDLNKLRLFKNKLTITFIKHSGFYKGKKIISLKLNNINDIKYLMIKAIKGMLNKILLNKNIIKNIIFNDN